MYIVSIILTRYITCVVNLFKSEIFLIYRIGRSIFELTVILRTLIYCAMM
jgi:hypothetical protein